MNKYILFILLALFNFNFAAAQVDDVNKDCNITVGLLRTEKETYSYELISSDKICEMFVNMGANVILIDYNKIVDFSQIKEEALSEAKNDILRAEELESNKIKVAVESFIKENNINRIFLPGNYYNIDVEPLSPTPNRQLITKAIAQIIDENPNISLLAVCGGLQGVMHAKGIEIIRMEKLSTEPKKSYHNEHRLNKLNVAPGNRLAAIISRFIEPGNDGWFSLYLPDAHKEAINNDDENIKKLESLGYKMIGFSDDHIIEAIEDQHSNIYFQGHPESLILRSKNYYSKHYKKRETAALITMAIINDFLYRKCSSDNS